MSDGSRLQRFSAADKDTLREFAKSLNLKVMLDDRFLDHYYLGQDWSQLFLTIQDGRCVGIIGVDYMPMHTPSGVLNAGFATNFYSSMHGVGGILWLNWMRSCQIGIVFGGSEDTHRILRGQRFRYWSGVNMYGLNSRYEPYAEDPVLKGTIKSVLRNFVRKPLPQYATRGFLEGSKQITVKEISVGDAVRTTNPLQSFSMVLAPGSEYLQWRYASDLGYVRYRTFQVFKAGEPSGFCILNDAPNVIIVSYAEGADPEILAKGIVKSIFALGEGKSRQHSAMLSSSDPRMQAVFGQAGFLPTALDRAYALGSLRGKLDSLGDSSSEWLINFGIGDNDLRQRYFWSNDAS